MVPSQIISKLNSLIQWKEMSIVKAFPVIQVYITPKSEDFTYKEHGTILLHNVQDIVNTLPRLCNELPLVVFAAKG